jgi:hypothetical protein
MTLKTRTRSSKNPRAKRPLSLSLFYLLKRRHLVNKKISTSPEGRGDGEGGSREPPPSSSSSSGMEGRRERWNKYTEGEIQQLSFLLKRDWWR